MPSFMSICNGMKGVVVGGALLMFSCGPEKSSSAGDAGMLSSKLFHAINKHVDGFPVDSLVVDTLLCKDEYTDKRMSFFNEQMTTTLFNRYTCMHSIRLHTGSGTHEKFTAITIVRFNNKDLASLKKVLSAQKINIFKSKIFNRYLWHTVNDNLIIIESFCSPMDTKDSLPLFFGIDSIVRKLGDDLRTK